MRCLAGHPALDKVLAEHTDIFGQDSSADVGDGGTALAGSSTDQAKVIGSGSGAPSCIIFGIRALGYGTLTS